MLDNDLAELYGVGTKVLNQAVKRNITRFPDEFRFQLNADESDDLRSQIVTSGLRSQSVTLKTERRGQHRKYLPYAFTEQGVAMLSSVLRSKKAIQVNIQIMMVFTKVREMLVDNLSLKLDIEEIKKKLHSHDKNIELVFNYLDELMEKQENPKPRKKIGYKRTD